MQLLLSLLMAPIMAYCSCHCHLFCCFFVLFVVFTVIDVALASVVVARWLLLRREEGLRDADDEDGVGGRYAG